MQVLKKITDQFWWDVARKCDYATFYHTPIWREVAVRSNPEHYRDETFGAILPSGVRVVFPLISSRRVGPFKWLASTYSGCYGGFIADGPVSHAETLQLYKQASTWSTYSLYMLENPLGQPIPDELKPKLSLFISEAAYAIKLDTDFDTIFSRFSRSRRTAYRSGIKQGVQIRLATSLEEYKTYFVNYRDAVDRWGEDENYGYKWGLFEQIYYLSKTYPDQIKLWLMIVNEQIVGGRLFFYWNQQASLWNGTAHRDFLHYDVMPVADTEILRDAIAHGYRYYDFNTSTMDEGVRVYKERFGAAPMPINGYFFKTPLLDPARKIYYGVRRYIESRRPAQAAPAPASESAPEQVKAPEGSA